MFEHVQLYATEDELAEGAGAVDLDHAAIRQAGDDATMITYGGSLPRALAAADELARGGHRGSR